MSLFINEKVNSPLNYTGSKYKLLSQIEPFFPDKVDIFIDLFCGGGNVGININSPHIIFNDINISLIGLLKHFKKQSSNQIIQDVKLIIKQYNLSNTYKNGYSYYECNSSAGLGKYNKIHYIKLRNDFNSLQKKDNKYYSMLYTLIIYAYNNQIRFNQKGDFNLPIGKRDFNQSMRKKLELFCTQLKNKNVSFTSIDFNKIDTNNLTENSFVYADPPYLLSCASYNENDNWNTNTEKKLYTFLDILHKKNIKFALSNVLEAKGDKNHILENWIIENKYNLHKLNFNYSNSSHNKKHKKYKEVEILVTNY